MPQKKKGSKNSTTTQTAQHTAAEATDTARKNYEQTVRTGQRVVEEAQAWWSRMFTQTATAQDWQKHFANYTSLAGNMLPLAQRRMEEVADWISRNNRTSAELMRKAVDAAQTPVVAESQDKWFDFWSASLKAVQSNIETATELSTKTIDTWIRFVRNNTEVTEVRTPKMA